MNKANGKKIIIVDDETDIVIVLTEFLKKEGFDVTSCSNGEDAIKQVASEDFDLMLLDISMPGMSGIEVLRDLHRSKPALAVIMITAFKDAEKVVECFRLGAFDCIFKPFDLKYLRKAILAKLLC